MSETGSFTAGEASDGATGAMACHVTVRRRPDFETDIAHAVFDMYEKFGVRYAKLPQAGLIGLGPYWPAHLFSDVSGSRSAWADSGTEAAHALGQRVLGDRRK
jgi:hypothetical protein